MPKFLPDPLNAEELAALRRIAAGLSKQKIPEHVWNRLKLCGYVTEVAKELVITVEDQTRLARGDKGSQKK